MTQPTPPDLPAVVWNSKKPCKQFKPVLNKLKKAGYPISFHDVDQDPILAESHKIQSVPQIKIEVDGKVEETMVGIQPLDTLLGKIHIHWEPEEE